MLFRLTALFCTAAITVLSIWALVGSYKNEAYLTSNYLISIQLSNLNVSAIVSDATNNAKRDYPPESYIPTPTENLAQRDISSLTEGVATNTDLAKVISSATAALAQATSVSTNVNSIIQELENLASTASIPDSVVTLAAELANEAEDTVSSLLTGLNALDLGLADMYSVGYWGYCRGSISGSSNKWLKDLGEFGKEFSNQAVDYDYCSSPKVGYKFDPLELLRHEIINHINNVTDGLSAVVGSTVSDELALQLLAIAGSITYENLGLPGSLKKNLDLLHNLTVASFGLILAGAVLAFISFLFQLVGLCCSPQNMCLSILNFGVMLVVFLVVLIGSALSTGAYVYVRKEVNNSISDFGAKAFLSVQYYAFLWSAVAAGILMLIIAFVGYCCGCFRDSGRLYRRVNHPEPEMYYDHKY